MDCWTSGAGEVRTEDIAPAADEVGGGGGGAAASWLLRPLGETEFDLNLMAFRRPEDFGR